MNTKIITNAWKIIAPTWPLKNFVKSNPLLGFEDLPFEQAMQKAASYFEYEQLPQELLQVNQQTIKWCQAFFDEGQSAIGMPLRELGFFAACKELFLFDTTLHKNKNALNLLQQLPNNPEKVIELCLQKLNIAEIDYEQFVILLLSTLSGWASYVKFRAEWDSRNSKYSYPVTCVEYLAIRLVITTLLWPEAKELLTWHAQQNKDVSQKIAEIVATEKQYKNNLLQKLPKTIEQQKQEIVDAQLLFCIDVRSEPFRRTLENKKGLYGKYQTFGCAGFFGLPIGLQENAESASVCPPMVTAKHVLNKQDCFEKKGTLLSKILAKTVEVYQSLTKYVITGFAQAEAIGLWSGLSMFLSTFLPQSSRPGKKSRYAVVTGKIPIEDQCNYAEGLLRAIGLTQNFAPLVVVCGHESMSQNNPYASALQCGACAGSTGFLNARVFTEICNNKDVRNALQIKGISIPEETFFVPAEHDTTQNIVTIFYTAVARVVGHNKKHMQIAANLKSDCFAVHKEVDFGTSDKQGLDFGKTRATNWAQTRPEWGLSKCASLIIGPREYTKNIDLESRTFLHSYDWQQDKDSSILAGIFAGPLVVGHWIASQYTFSTLHNVAYGSGSKITHNVTGKMGVMQGNASDLMRGLPLQSLYKNDTENYHQPMRLLVVVYAPQHIVDLALKMQPEVQKLIAKKWVIIKVVN